MTHALRWGVLHGVAWFGLNVAFCDACKSGMSHTVFRNPVPLHLIDQEAPRIYIYTWMWCIALLPIFSSNSLLACSSRAYLSIEAIWKVVSVQQSLECTSFTVASIFTRVYTTGRRSSGLNYPSHVYIVCDTICWFCFAPNRGLWPNREWLILYTHIYTHIARVTWCDEMAPWELGVWEFI